MSDGWCGLDLIGVREPQRQWLLRAMRDVGVPVAGWSNSSRLRRHLPGMSLTVRSPGAEAKRVIEGLWENERPGYPIEIEVVYG